MIGDREDICRAWQSPAYARCYAHAYEATLARRTSRFLECAMIRRVLRRLRRHQYFHSRLDCRPAAGGAEPRAA